MLSGSLYLEKIALVEDLIISKDFDSALLICHDMIENQIYTDVESIYIVLSRIYLNLKKYNEALSYFLKVNNIALKNNKYYFLKGQIFEKLKDIENAENGYYIALRKIPKNQKYLKKYIDFVTKNNLYDSAIKKMEKIVLSKPEKSFFLNLEIAKYYIEKNNLKKSFSILNELKVSNELEKGLVNEAYSLIYESFGDYENCFNYLSLIENPNILQNVKKDEILFKMKNCRLDMISNFYNFDFIKKNNILTIVFSSIENKFILRGYSFNTSVLFLSEKLMTYYTYQYENLIKYLCRVIKENNIKEINLVGSSKGSFAAINISLGLEKVISNKLRVVAFSPQSYIYPLNKNIQGLPSYKGLLKKSKEYMLMNDDLRSFGNPIERMNGSNVQIKIVYGEDHVRDKKEAENFYQFSNVQLLPIAGYPFHTSMLIYTKKDEKLKIALNRKIDSRSKDDQFFKPENNDILINQILNNIHKYDLDLNDLLLN